MTNLRMGAYYYSFDLTGVGPVDFLLSAIASAGKAFHHTADWGDALRAEPYRGDCPVEWIQNAANDLASYITELKKGKSGIDNERLRGVLFELVLRIDNERDPNDPSRWVGSGPANFLKEALSVARMETGR